MRYFYDKDVRRCNTCKIKFTLTSLKISGMFGIQGTLEGWSWIIQNCKQHGKEKARSKFHSQEAMGINKLANSFNRFVFVWEIKELAFNSNFILSPSPPCEEKFFIGPAFRFLYFHGLFQIPIIFVHFFYIAKPAAKPAFAGHFAGGGLPPLDLVVGFKIIIWIF